MSNQNLVPRANGSGSIGIPTKKWGTGSFSTLQVDSVNLTGSYSGDGSGLTNISATWDGTLNGDASITGSLIVSGSNSSITAELYKLDTNILADPAHSTGQLYWDTTNKTVAVDMEGSSVTMQVGQEQYLYARNTTGATISNGDIVKISGATGNKITIELAIAETGSIIGHLENKVIGVATEDISNNSLGYVTTFGTVRGLDTSAYTEGNILYLSPSTAGSGSSTPPSAPYNVVRLGVVERSHPTLGQLFVNVRPSAHFSDITGVTGSNIPVGRSYPEYNSATNITSFVDTLTGSFNGSFAGNGSGLTGISSSPDGTVTRVSSSTYNIASGDYRIGIKYSLTGSGNYQLPLVSDVPAQLFKFKDEEGNALVNNLHIIVSGSDSIDGSLTASLSGNYHGFTLYNDSVDKWFIE